MKALIRLAVLQQQRELPGNVIGHLVKLN